MNTSLPFPSPFPREKEDHDNQSKRGLHLEQKTGGVLDGLLELDKEGNGLPAIDETVIVGKGDVHHGTDLDLAVDGNGPLLDGVHAEDSGLGHVDDRGTVEGTKNATIGDGEGTTDHVLQGELPITGAGGEGSNGLFHTDKAHVLDITEDGGDKTLGGGDGDRDIDVITVDNGITTIGTNDGGIDPGDLLKGDGGGTDKGGHEA